MLFCYPRYADVIARYLDAFHRHIERVIILGPVSEDPLAKLPCLSEYGQLVYRQQGSETLGWSQSELFQVLIIPGNNETRLGRQGE